jgi:hypothetical protein
MQITTRNDGANIVVELNGGKVAAFDHIEGDLDHARMQAEAYARGLKDGLALAKSIPDEDLPKLPDHHPMALKPPMSLYTWTSEAVSDGVQPGTLVAMARDVDDARDMIHTAAFAERRAPGHGLSSAQLEHDLEAEPRIVASGALVISP